MRWWWKDAYCTFVLGIFRSQTEITHSYYLVQPFCTRGHWGFQATEFWYLASEDLVMVVMVDKSALPLFPYALYLCASKVSFCFLIPELRKLSQLWGVQRCIGVFTLLCFDCPAYIFKKSFGIPTFGFIVQNGGNSSDGQFAPWKVWASSCNSDHEGVLLSPGPLEDRPHTESRSQPFPALPWDLAYREAQEVWGLCLTSICVTLLGSVPELSFFM